MLATWANQENQVKSRAHWRTRFILQTVLVGAQFYLVSF